MRNISYHHNLITTNGMACVEIWYTDNATSMTDVRFENNLCANTGDDGWSANQRPDPAGRTVCVYGNTAKTTRLSVQNNIFVCTAGFEAMIYITDPYVRWAKDGLILRSNALFHSADIPPSPRGPGSVGNEHSLLKTRSSDGTVERYVAGNWSLLAAKYSGAGSGSILVDPQLDGLRLVGGASISIADITAGARPKASSPLIMAGADVIWLVDYDGNPVPKHFPDVGPFQHKYNPQPAEAAALALPSLKSDDITSSNSVLAWVETKRMNASELSTQLEVIKSEWNPVVSTVSCTVYQLLPDDSAAGVTVVNWPAKNGGDPSYNSEWFSGELLKAGFRTTPLVQLGAVTGAPVNQTLALMRKLFTHEATRATVIATLVQKCEQNSWSGLCVDIEETATLMTPADGEGYAQFLSELSDAIHASSPHRTVSAAIAGWGTVNPEEDYLKLYQFALLNKTRVDRLIQMTSYTDYNLNFLRAMVGAALHIDSGREGCCGRHYPNRRLGAGLCPACYDPLSLPDLKMRLDVLRSLTISHVDLWLDGKSFEENGGIYLIPSYWMPPLKEYLSGPSAMLKTDDTHTHRTGPPTSWDPIGITGG